MPTSPPPRRVSLFPPELDELDSGWGADKPIVPSRPPALPSTPPGVDLEAQDNEDRITSVPDEPRDEFARRVMAAAVTEPPPRFAAGSVRRPTPSPSPLGLPGSGLSVGAGLSAGAAGRAQPATRSPSTSHLAAATASTASAPSTSGSSSGLAALSGLGGLASQALANPGLSSRDVKTAPARPVRILDDPRPPEDDPFDRPTKAGVRSPHPSEIPTAPPPARGDVHVEQAIPRTTSVKSFLLQSDLPTEPPPPTHREPLSLLDRARRAVTPVVRPDPDQLHQERELALEGDSQLRALDVGSFGSSIDIGAGLDISGRFSSAPPAQAEPMREMKDRFAMGDFSGSLEIAELILREDPLHTEARNLAEKCRDVLYDMYASRIDGMDRTLRVIMGPDQIRWLSLDHRSGFLLSMVDGITTVEELLDVSGMPRLDALRLVCDLMDQKVIGLDR